MRHSERIENAFHLYLCIYVYLSVSAHVNAVPEEARKGHWIPWNWNCWLRGATWYMATGKRTQNLLRQGEMNFISRPKVYKILSDLLKKINSCLYWNDLRVSRAFISHVNNMLNKSLVYHLKLL